VDTLEPKQTSVDECAKDREHAKGQTDSESTADVPVSVMVASHAKMPLAGVVSGHVTGVDEFTPQSHGFKVVGCEEVCGLLIERLQDMSVFLCFSRCLVIARI
jgi:hypothetical protein